MSNYLTTLRDRFRLSRRVTKQDLKELGDKIMSAISNYTDQVNTIFTNIGDSVDKIVASVAGVSKDVASLKATIDKLQNSPGQITPEDQALLDNAQSQANALSTKVKGASDALAALDAQTEEPPTPPTT